MPTGTTAVANLALEILTPALECAIGHQCASVMPRGPRTLSDLSGCIGPSLPSK